MTEVFVKVGFLALAALNGAIIFTIMDVKGASWMQRRPVSYTHLTLPTNREV